MVNRQIEPWLLEQGKKGEKCNRYRMAYIFVYILLIVSIILFLLVFIIFVIYYLVCDFLGAPFVPTSKKYINQILKGANLQKGQVFLELGSGDGRVVRTAVIDYGVFGIGVDLNPVLVIYAKTTSYLEGSNVDFRRENFYSTDLSKADVIFCFLVAKSVAKLKTRLIKTCKKNVLIISHGFKIPGLEKYKIRTIYTKPFPTHYYQGFN